MLSAINLLLVASGQELSTLSCPDQYELQGKICIRQVREKAKYHCEEGILFRDRCTFSSSPVVKCPSGSKLVEGVCTVVHPVSKIKKDCPAGFEDDGTGCIKHVSHPLEAVCPFGDFDMSEDLCVVEKTVPPMVKHYCPPGTTEDGKGCSMEVALETMGICEQGVLEDDSCVYIKRDQPIDMGEYCPEGTIRDGENCVREMPGHVIETCPEGEVNEAGLCEMFVSRKINKRPQCPKGFERDGLKCKQRRDGYLVDRCPRKSVRDAEGCVKYETAHKIRNGPKCPEGYSPNQGKDGCYKTVVYDCTPLISGKNPNMRRTQHDITVARTCEKKEYADEYYDESCPNGFEEIDGTCTKEISVEMEQVCNIHGKDKDLCFDYVYKRLILSGDCEAPFVMKDGVCGRIVEINPKKICAETGSFDINNCYATQNIAVLKEVGCPVGYDLKEGICYQKVHAQPKQVCEDQRKSVEDCSITHRVAPVVRAVCPQGSVQDDDSLVTCVERTTFHPVKVCPNGHSIKDCYDEIRLPYQLQCPFGSVEQKKGECQKLSVYESVQYCDNGDMLINGSCIKTIPALSDCPVGTTTRAGFCIGTIMEDAIVSYTKTCVGKGCEF